MFRYLATIMALIIFPVTLSHALQFRTIADMEAVFHPCRRRLMPYKTNGTIKSFQIEESHGQP